MSQVLNFRVLLKFMCVEGQKEGFVENTKNARLQSFASFQNYFSHFCSRSLLIFYEGLGFLCYFFSAFIIFQQSMNLLLNFFSIVNGESKAKFVGFIGNMIDIFYVRPMQHSDPVG